VKNLNTAEETHFLSCFTDLVEITDSFDQLALIAEIGDIFYSEKDPVRAVLFTRLEKMARHLRRLPEIGLVELPRD
jgi:hypothetical protein